MQYINLLRARAYGNNTGNNILDGGTGADAMRGGAGNDRYTFDNAGDSASEELNEGIDTVQTTFSYTLLNNFENLTLLGTSGLTATGNAVNNVLTGNSGANTLTPTISKRSIRTQISVNDQQTVVLGGLISANSQKTKSGVPMLPFRRCSSTARVPGSLCRR